MTISGIPQKSSAANAGMIAPSLSVLDYIQDSVVTYDRDWRFTNLNKAVEEIIGKSRESLFGKLLWDEFPNLGETLRREFERAMNERVAVHFEFFDSASNKWFDTRAYPIEEGVLAIYHDITARKQAEAAQRETETLYKNLVDLSPDAICVHDGNTILFANEAAARLFGAPSLDDLIGTSAVNIVFPEDREPAREIIKRMFRENIGFAPREVRFLRFDGTQLDAELVASPLMFQGRRAIQAIIRDISERHKAEDDLRQSEEKFRSLIAHATDIITVLEADGTIRYESPSIERILGFAPDELLGKNCFDFVHPEDKPAVFGYFLAKLNNDGIATPVQFRFRHKTGSWRLLEAIGNNRLSDPIIGGIIVNSRDVTERRQTEEALHRSEALIDTLINTAPLILFATDRNGTITVSEGKGLEKLGLVSGQNVGQSLMDLYGETVFEESSGRQKTIKDAYERALSGKTAWGSCDFSGFYYEVYLMPHFNSSNEVIGVIGVASDSTERKKIEQRLRDSEERYRMLFERNPQPMWVWDRDTLEFLAVNDALIKHYGYTREEFLKMTVKDIRPAEDVAKFLQVISEVKDGVDFNISARHQKKDGTLINIEATCHHSNFGDKRAEIVLINDVTERLELEEKLRQAQKMEAVGQLAGGIAHDFNNLLTAILGQSNLLLMRMNQHDPLRVKIEDIKQAGERAADLTRQLLAFSRKQILQPQVLQLNDAVREVKDMLPHIIGEHIEIIENLAPDCGQVLADAGQISQVLVNLAVNARDAMPEGGKLIIETSNFELDEAYARTHPAVEPGQYVMLAVSDTGCGMDGETLKHIFEPFFTTKEVGKGTGLGLSTVYGIIKQSRGHIEVYSEPGRGTSFKIYLPRVDTLTLLEENHTVKYDFPKGTETILLVEDEEMVRKLVREVLETCGYRVIEAGDGADALLRAAEFQGEIQLLVSDIVMPKMSGKQLAENLKDLGYDFKVLYMSGYTDTSIIQQGVLHEGVNFIQKPFTFETLMKRVRAALDLETNEI